MRCRWLSVLLRMTKRVRQPHAAAGWDDVKGVDVRQLVVDEGCFVPPQKDVTPDPGSCYEA